MDLYNAVSCDTNIIPSVSSGSCYLSDNCSNYASHLCKIILFHVIRILFGMTLICCSYLDCLYISAAVLPLSRIQTQDFRWVVSIKHVRFSFSFLLFSVKSFIFFFFAVFWYLAQRIVTKYRKENGFHRGVLLKPIKSYYKAWELCEHFKKSKCDEKTMSKSWGISRKQSGAMENKGIKAFTK